MFFLLANQCDEMSVAGRIADSKIKSWEAMQCEAAAVKAEVASMQHVLAFTEKCPFVPDWYYIFSIGGWGIPDARIASDPVESLSA